MGTLVPASQAGGKAKGDNMCDRPPWREYSYGDDVSHSYHRRQKLGLRGGMRTSRSSVTGIHTAFKQEDSITRLLDVVVGSD